MHVSPPPGPPPRQAGHRKGPEGFALLWLAALLVPTLGVVAAGVMSWQDVHAEARARLDRTAEMLRQHALRAFGTQETILAAAARTTDGASWTELRQSRPAHALLADLSAAGAPVVSGVLLADPQARITVASYEYPARPADLSDRDYIGALRDGATRSVGEVVEARPMGWRVFAVARGTPARRDGGAEAGFVISSFSPAPIEEFYASIAATPRDVVALLRTDGAVLARHPPLGPAEEPGLRPRLASLLDLPRGAGQPTHDGPSPVDGYHRLYALRDVGDWPVVVAYGLSADSLHAAWRQRMIAPLAGGVAAAVLLLGLTALARRGAQLRREEAESRAEAEAQLARAGRAAAIGLLAAGLAHDIKNLVQAVRSGARLMERRADDPAEIRRCAALLGDAAERGRRLVDSMLAFARGGGEPDGEVPPLDVSAALFELTELLGRTLGSGWRVQVTVPPGLSLARGDRAGFEASIVNLAANARDAMPGGGRVTISAWVEELRDADDVLGLRPGRYVVAAVRDTGSGMDEATVARLGEPFFTTKPPGSGTGLGLASVRGFCARAGGALRIESAPERGTTAAMWLPAA
jgi:two-component system NtrC family sensor kinase